MSFPPNLGITNSFIIDSNSSIFHEFPSLLPHLHQVTSPFNKHIMNGYSRIKKSAANRSKSLDFADLSLSRSVKPQQTTRDPIPENQDDGEGEVFGDILGRKCGSGGGSGRFAAAEMEMAAAKRSFSVKRSASVSDGYSRIHRQCVEGREELIGSGSRRVKKKGKLFGVFRRLFGI